MNPGRIAALESMLRQIINLGGYSERTRIVLNRPVVDSSPADLPAGYIRIEDENGFYTPAVLSGGLSVSNGDFVNILRIQGTEDLAFQHGSASSGGASGGGSIPAPGKVKLWDVSAGAVVDYDTLPDAIAAYGNNDIIVLGAGDYDIGSAQIANSDALSLVGQGRTITTLTSSHATEIFKPTADLTVEGITINATGGGDAFTIDDTTVIIRDVTYEIAFGPSIVGLNIGSSAEALVTIEYSRFVVGGGTAITIGNNSSALYLYGGYFGGATAISHTNTPTISMHDTPTLVGSVSSLANGIYIDANGNLILGPNSVVDFEEGASAPSTPATGRWRLYTKSDGFYQIDDAGAETSLAQSGSSGREILTAQLDLYVATTGSDSNDGSSGSPFLTIQKAIDTIVQYDLSTFDATVSVADGTYTLTSGIVIPAFVSSGGQIWITGNTTTPANTLLTSSSAITLMTFNHSAKKVTFQGFRLTGSHGSSILISAVNQSIVDLGYMTFGAAGTHHMLISGGAFVNWITGYTIDGGTLRHIDIGTLAQITCINKTVTLTGTPAFSGQFIIASDMGMASLYGNTYSGSATGQRYNVSWQATVRTDGGTLPGNAAGATSEAGHYG